MPSRTYEVPGAGGPGLQTTPLGIQDTPGLRVSDAELGAPVGEKIPGEISPGRVNVVESSDLDLELQIRTPPPLDSETLEEYQQRVLVLLVGQRIGLKVTWGSTPPATITVIAPPGMTIEADSGNFGAESELSGNMYGRVYREWICDSALRWVLVALIDAPAVG